MNTFILTKQNFFLKRFLCGLTAFFFLGTSVFPNPSIAQTIPSTILNLPVPGSVVAPTAGFAPAMIKGVNLYPDNPLKFDFIIDKGDSTFTDEEFKKESTKLIKYFLSSLTVPEDEMWVNLSPYEKNRIVPQDFGKTEMGRDLLAQDYMLKQLTASLMNPDDKLGGEFWQRVYTKAQEKYGSTDIPMNTFNKIWIVPEKAVVYEHEKGAFVVKSHLKVLLEEDYLALDANKNSTKHGLGDVKVEDLKVVSGVQSAIIKDLLIPEIEKEVNEGKTFANLRQIYNAVILASWYKQALKESLLGQVYIDQKKTKGVETDDKTVNEKIYNQYVESFKKGVYNTIKEDYNPETQEVVNRKYFSGGAIVNPRDKLQVDSKFPTADLAQLTESPQEVIVDLTVFGKEILVQEQNSKKVEFYSGKLFHGTTINALLGLKRTDGIMVSPVKAQEIGIPVFSGEFARGQAIPEGDTISVSPNFETAMGYANLKHEFNMEAIQLKLSEAQKDLNEAYEKGYGEIDLRVRQTKVDRWKAVLANLMSLNDQERQSLIDNDAPIVLGFTDSVSDRARGRVVDQRVNGTISIDKVARIYVLDENRKTQVEKILSDLKADHVKVKTFEEVELDFSVNQEGEKIYLIPKNRQLPEMRKVVAEPTVTKKMLGGIVAESEHIANQILEEAGWNEEILDEDERESLVDQLAKFIKSQADPDSYNRQKSWYFYRKWVENKFEGKTAYFKVSAILDVMNKEASKVEAIVEKYFKERDHAQLSDTDAAMAAVDSTYIFILIALERRLRDVTGDEEVDQLIHLIDKVIDPAWLRNRIGGWHKFLNDVLIPKGYFIELNESENEERTIVTYKINRHEIKNTNQGPVTGYFIDQITKFKDGQLRGTLGWNTTYNDYVIVFSGKIIQKVNRIQKILNGQLPFTLSSRFDILKRKGRMQYRWARLSRAFIQKGLIKMNKTEDIISLEENSIFSHEVEHERQARALGRDLWMKMSSRKKEIFAYLRSMEEADEPFSVLGDIIHGAVFNESYAWYILQHLSNQSSQRTIFKDLRDRFLRMSVKEFKTEVSRVYQEAERDATMTVESNQMLKKTNATATPGGIDLNPTILNTEIKRNGRGVIVPAFRGVVPDLKGMEGFVPNIINVTPVTNLQFLLGLDTKSKESPEHSENEKPVDVSFKLSALPVKERD